MGERCFSHKHWGKEVEKRRSQEVGNESAIDTNRLFCLDCLVPEQPILDLAQGRKDRISVRG